MIQVYNRSPIAVLENGALPFAARTDQKGRTATLEGGEISLNAPGVYMIVANFSFTATAAGDVTITETVNGVPVLPEVATATATAAGTVNLTIPSLVQVDRCGDPVSVGYVVGAAGTLVSSNATVTKIC